MIVLISDSYKKNNSAIDGSVRSVNFEKELNAIVEKWEQPFFVTLTVKAVSFRRLPEVMRSM